MANDILVTVGANITQFSRAMSKMSSDMSKFSGEMSGLGSAVSKVGGTLTKGITLPAVAAATALAGITLVKGYGRLVGIDTARAKLSALGHDAESVESIMTSALDSVKGTSYGLDEAATAAASAVASGVKPGQDLTKYLSSAADAAAVAGVSFNEMAPIFNRVQTAQRAYTMELNMLADRGIPIYQWLADEAGSSAEAVRDMARNGEISSELYFAAIEKNIGGAAKVIGEQSFAAALRNIGSDIARIGANFLDAGGEAGGFFSTVKPLLTEFRNYLESIEPVAAEMGKKFGEAFIGMIDKLRALKQWYDDLSPSMQTLIKWTAALGTAFMVVLGPALLLVGKGLTFMFVTVPAIVAGIKGLIPVIQLLVGKLAILRGAIAALSGPVGWVTLGVGALVTGVIAAVKWFNRTSAETEKLNDSTEDLGESTDALVDNINDGTDAYKEQQRSVESSAAANANLASKIEDLSGKENKSAADKALLAQSIEELNGRVEGLSLAYDAEADSMNMSSEELANRLGLMKETEAGMAAQERMTEIMEEQNEAQLKLNEINALREEWNQKLADGTVKAKEAEEGIATLDEQEQGLKNTMFELGEQYGITEQQAIEAAQNAATAIEEGNLRQITSYDELGDEHKEVFDNMQEVYEELASKATDAFDRMNSESKVTAEEMIANLEHNQKMTEQWAENSAKLYDWAGKEGHDGFLTWLESMGPESAAELAEVSNMGDTELKRFAELMDKGAESAGDNFKTSLGNEFDDAIDVMIQFINDGSQSMRQQIETSGFDDIGKMVPEGLVGGIKGGTSDVENAAEGMATGMIDSTKHTLGINSPSRVYRDFGTNVTEGLSGGIQKGTAGVMTAIRQMLQRVRSESINQLNGINRIFRSQTSAISNTMITGFTRMGTYAMAGLRNGLNAGRASVMASARSIANSAAATMRSALQIKSPSRITQSIGEFVGLGLAKGISDTTRQVMKASEVLAKAATPEIPKLAGLDTGNVRGYVSEVSAHLSTEVGDGNSVGETTNNFRGMLEGAVFHVREQADIDRIATELAKKHVEAQEVRGVRVQRG